VVLVFRDLASGSAVVVMRPRQDRRGVVVLFGPVVWCCVGGSGVFFFDDDDGRAELGAFFRVFMGGEEREVGVGWVDVGKICFYERISAAV